MGDLLARLQSALGDPYRIERELGGGGMSRVFLAQETALKRPVVIKVLPPEMAAGVNVERFRREVELAASLQHPHIVPLLSAAASGDLLYYTMPLVEGESLRAKLARQGELPVSETIRVLADVADALAHGVVHRDIKPDNVLISGKHAVVTDFGVSKAVSASSGGSLTSLGVALGTPAYMAPEQAAADPHLDHRADLYALGILGYEMLTGRPPFTAATPQATLAAQVTQTPQPVTAQRPVMPGAIGLLVAGLPIMVVTGLIERRRALARTTGHMTTPPAGGLRGWLTWRKAVGGGVAAFAALGLGAAAYTAMRVLGIGPVGTLVASGVLKKRDRLVLADFTNRTPDTTLGRSLGEAFRVDLAQSPVVRLLDASAVADALRRCSQGVRAEDGGDVETAISLLREATALDTGFAMAYRKLGVVLGNSGAAREQILAATRKAFEHRDRLPEVERYLAIAYFYFAVDHDPARQMAAYRSVLERDPENTTALNNLALALNVARRGVEAETLALRATALGSSWTFYNNAMWAEAGQGHRADVQATLDRYARALPHNPRVQEARTFLAAARGDYALAERQAQALQQEQRTSPVWKARTSTYLFSFDELRGRLRQAEQDARDFQAASEQRGLPGDYVGGALDAAWLDLRYRNRPAAALERVEAALRRHPLASMPAADRPYPELARFYARAGRLDQAKRLVAEFERNVTEGLRRGVSLRHAAAADIALSEGRTRDAITGYRAWYDENEYGCPSCGWLELAGIYDKGRQSDSALAIYERIVATPGMFRRFFHVIDDSYGLAPTFKRLGELYEARSDRGKALEYYGRFVDLWKGADPELQPVVKEAAEH